jgi:hypothetical protein
MSISGLSGLASGVDTSSIVDQLISLERQANDDWRCASPPSRRARRR